MIATFSLTNDDLIAQQKNAINNTKFHKKSRIMQLIISFALVIFVLVAAGHSRFNVMVGVVLCLILTPLIWKSYEYGIIRRYKRDIIKQHKNKMGSFSLKLSEEELIKESKNSIEKFRWDELDRLTEDKERYYLYLTDLSVITIKKKPDNMNEEEVMEYQSFIKRKMNN